MSVLVAGLIITGIGMGLVFVMILLLWWLMYLMVRGAARLEKSAEENNEEQEEAVAEATVAPDGRKVRAAAAAVAVAMALQRVHARSQQSAMSVSPWQAAGRAVALGDRANLFTRKNRGA
jgi:sodium pump decarboxylase gamma subunit